MGEFIPVSPGSVLEDWQAITEKVIYSSYPLEDKSGRNMSLKLVMCDSGGKDGTTGNAYDYWRK